MRAEDRQLLALAAKAAGKHANQWAEPGTLLADKGGWVQFVGYGRASIWNPLTDCVDAFGLQVQLHLRVRVQRWGRSIADNADSKGEKAEVHGNDPLAATRRAIVRAAAAIGEAMP